MEAEKDILEAVREGALSLPPLSFMPVKPNRRQINRDIDMLVEATWEGKRYLFALEAKRYGSDKLVRAAAEQARAAALTTQANPLIVVPWLSDEQLAYLEQREVSGVDLCGNGVVIVPGQLLIVRSGQPNRYPASRLIRRVYEGTSSLVGRVLLLRTVYDSVSEILDEMLSRGERITLPTVSKALKQMEEDLVVERANGRIRLLQADKLLDRLQRDYSGVRASDSVRGKLAARGSATPAMLLQQAAEKAKIQLVMSGESSADVYATMGKEPIDTFFCSEVKRLHLEAIGFDVSSKFPNVELCKTDSPLVYFDMRKEKRGNIASPIQAYLEMAGSDKRGKEIAEQIREQILEAAAQDLKSRRRK